jgi:tetratricopeptide (TPR) repeat protein
MNLGFKLLSTAVFSLMAVSYSFAEEKNFCVKKFNNSKEKVVFLAGGNAYDLFNSYLRELREKGQDVKVGDVKIYFFDGTKGKEVSFSWQDWLTGKSPDEIAKQKLSKYNAVINQNELAKALQTGKDIYCVDTSKAVVSQNTNVKDKEQQKKGFCPTEAQSQINLGLQFVTSKDYDNAIKEFSAAINKYPTCPLSYANLAQVYLEKKDYNFAIDTYKKGVSSAGDDWFLHYTGALVYSAKGDYDYALESLEKSLKSGFSDRKLLEDKLITKLFEKKKDAFCNLMDKYKIMYKKCL